MAIEYGYVEVRNSKVANIQPAIPSLPSYDHLEDYDVVLNKLYEAGWEPTNPKFRPGFGVSVVRIKREREFSEPTIPTDRRVAVVHITATTQEDFHQQVEGTRRLYEVNGWDLIQVWDRGGTNFGPTMFFSKPKSAPDAQPFVDPNKPK